MAASAILEQDHSPVALVARIGTLWTKLCFAKFDLHVSSQKCSDRNEDILCFSNLRDFQLLHWMRKVLDPKPKMSWKIWNLKFLNSTKLQSILLIFCKFETFRAFLTGQNAVSNASRSVWKVHSRNCYMKSQILKLTRSLKNIQTYFQDMFLISEIIQNICF